MRNSFQTIRLTAFLAFLSATLIMVPIMGCTPGQLQAVQDGITVAASVATSAAALFPEYAPAILLGGQILKDAGNLYAAYVQAAAADKPGIEGKLHALLTTGTANLGTILADARIKNSDKIGQITAYVQVANTVFQLILNHLPKSAPQHAMIAIQSANLPVVHNASAQDLAKTWNNAVGAEHPEAVVNAPKHPKKLGIF